MLLYYDFLFINFALKFRKLGCIKNNISLLLSFFNFSIWLVFNMKFLKTKKLLINFNIKKIICNIYNHIFEFCVGII